MPAVTISSSQCAQKLRGSIIDVAFGGANMDIYFRISTMLDLVGKTTNLHFRPKRESPQAHRRSILSVSHTVMSGC